MYHLADLDTWENDHIIGSGSRTFRPFASLSFLIGFPFPSGSEIQHLDQRREGHGKVDISFVHMLADAFSY